MGEIKNKLIEKFSNAVGMLYDPKGIKKGEREFTEVFFKQTAERDDLSIDEKMALIQEYKFLISRNNNKKAIIQRSESYLKETANPGALDNSWILTFWEKSATITDDFLQDIWGQVLAQEVNAPKTISKRLLHNLSLMSVSDARNFMNLARFCFDDIKDGSGHPLLYIKEHAHTYSRSRITTNILKELELFSLIEVNYEPGFVYEQKKILKYKTHTIEIESAKIKAGNVRLTEDGQQLYRVVCKRENEQIFEYTIELLQYMGYDVKTY